MKIYGSDNSELMQVSGIERKGNELILKGKIFGAMPMVAKIHPEEARSALGLLNIRTFMFIVSMVFRRRVNKKQKAKTAQ